MVLKPLVVGADAMHRRHLKMSLTSQTPPAAPWLRNHWDLLGWLVLVAVVNTPLLTGAVNTRLIFLSDPVRQGQWWRLLTFPLVHLSWYHLVLDAGGFLLVYSGFETRRARTRLLAASLCGAGSLFFGLCFGEAGHQGLSGLSGIAHGLMAFSALEMMRCRRKRSWGGVCLSMVVLKSTFEMIQGEVFFAFLHMGLCGLPVAACHAGGVVGGLIGFMLIRVCSLARERYLPHRP
jgi:rhomboid family GlyGly-CTERM serine protease